MSTRSNYFSSLDRPTLYPLITIPTTPFYPSPPTFVSSEPESAIPSCDTLPTPRQRKGRSRGLSISIPPPLEKLRRVEIVVTYQPSRIVSGRSTKSGQDGTSILVGRSSRLVNQIQQDDRAIWDEEIHYSAELRSRIHHSLLIFVCLALVLMGFTMLILIMIIPINNLPSFLQKHI